MSCSGSLKKGIFGYQWQATLALVGPIYDTSVESTIFAGSVSLKFVAEVKKQLKLSSYCWIRNRLLFDLTSMTMVMGAMRKMCKS